MFSYNEDMQCGYPAYIDITEMTCDGSTVCNFGDRVDVEGTLRLLEDLETSTLCTVTKTCFMGVNINFLCEMYDAEMDACETLGLTSMDGSACPAQASYWLKSSIQLPNRTETRLGSGKGATS